MIVDPATIPLDTRRRIARESPAGWAWVASRGRWQAAPHLVLLSTYLRRLATGEIRRLMVSMPPRHGKSELCSRYFPGWWLGMHQGHRVILTTYSEALASIWSARTREDLAEHGRSMFGATVRARAAATDWEVLDAAGRRTGGGLVAPGVGGSLTGRGADLLVMDDLVKGHEDSASQAQRDRLWAWLEQVALTRLEPSARVLAIGTRWHEDDYLGRLVTASDSGELSEPWTVVNLPALAEDDDPLGRAPGAALWPARYDEAALDARRREVGPTTWSALYQGRPSPASGGIFRREWLRYAEHDQRGILRCGPHGFDHQRDPVTIALDLAASEKTSADYTAAAVLGGLPHGAGHVLLEVSRDRLEAPKLAPFARDLLRRYPTAGVLWVERTGLGLPIVQHLRDAGIPVREVEAKGDKVARALPVTASMEGGCLWLCRGPWLADFLAELLAFDRGKHDDQVDALAHAHWAATNSRPSLGPIAPPERTRDDEDEDAPSRSRVFAGPGW